MSIEEFLNGTRLPHPHTLMTRGPEGGPIVPLRPARDCVHGTHISTGRGESDWVGSCLLRLASAGGEWNIVPWRMLRNAFQRYGFLKQTLMSSEKLRPPFYEEEPTVTIILGSGRQPPEYLLIGLKDLVDRGYVMEGEIEGETYLAIMPKLANLVPEPFRMDVS